MSKKLLVEVVYGGEIEKALRSTPSRYKALPPMVDVRFQPFIWTNEEYQRADRVLVNVNHWIIDDIFRIKMDQQSDGDSAIDMNTVLTILSHFGFDAKYNPKFVRRIEPVIAEVMLRAYKHVPHERISPRMFHDELMERKVFFEKFDNFLVKYGM